MNVCSGRGKHSYMARMYADKNIHIAFVLEEGLDVKKILFNHGCSYCFILHFTGNYIECTSPLPITPSITE